MKIIHMDTEQVRQVANQLDQRVYDLLDMENDLQQAGAWVADAYYGGAKPESYHLDFKALLAEFKEQVQGLTDNASLLRRQVNLWEDVDSRFGRSMSGFLLTMPVMAAASPVLAAASRTKEKFNWYKPGSTTVKEGLKLLNELPYDSVVGDSWKGIGRTLNLLKGNLKWGAVGNMDRIGHIVKSPAVQKGAPFALGVVGDLLKGDRLDRAVGSELVETLAEHALPMAIGGAIGGIIGGVVGAAAGGVGAVPGAVLGAKIGAHAGIWGYKAYQVLLAAGSIYSGILEMRGNHESALWLQNNIEKMDVGENIGNSVYDGLYNYATGGATP